MFGGGVIVSFGFAIFISASPLPCKEKMNTNMNLDFKTEILYTPASVGLWNSFDGGSKLVIFWV